MAHVEKYTDNEVSPILRHNSRKIKNNSNPDIDPYLSRLNYSLAPKRRMDPYAYYRKRKRQLYCYGRKDVKTMAGFIVTLPEEVTDPKDQNAFFKATYDFLEERYGKENVIQATVHYDEGKREKVKDPVTGEQVLNPDGSPKTRLIIGQPHLHFCWIPVAKVDQSKLVRKNSDGEIYKTHSEMGLYEEKICAKEVLNRTELQRFHNDLQKYLSDKGIKGKVLNGATKGKGYTVAQLKERTELQMKIHELEAKLQNMEPEQKEITYEW